MPLLIHDFSLLKKKRKKINLLNTGNKDNNVNKNVIDTSAIRMRAKTTGSWHVKKREKGNETVDERTKRKKERVIGAILLTQLRIIKNTSQRTVSNAICIVQV